MATYLADGPNKFPQIRVAVANSSLQGGEARGEEVEIIGRAKDARVGAVGD